MNVLIRSGAVRADDRQARRAQLSQMVEDLLGRGGPEDIGFGGLIFEVEVVIGGYELVRSARVERVLSDQSLDAALIQAQLPI